MGCTFSGFNLLYDAVNGGGDVWINERRFKIIRQLGEGGFAYVYLVKEQSGLSPGKRPKDTSHLSEDGIYALKKVLTQTDEQLQSVKQEIHVSSLFSHPNLLPLLDHSIIAVKGPQEGTWNQEAYLLFPAYLNGTLLDNAQSMKAKNEYYPPGIVLHIFKQLCAGLKHMHSFDPPYAHNDVKPGNVLIKWKKSQPPLAVLMDFGSAAPAKKEVRSRSEALKVQNKQKATNKKLCLSETTLNSNANEPGKESQEDEGVVLAPQVQVINGQIVINEESLVVSHRELNVNDIQTYRRVEETSSKLNYHTYMNRTPVERWSKSDTELFYKAMQQFGTDFGMIQHLFPGRTRRQVKAKFKIEERKHPLQLANALIHRPQDHSHFEMLIDRLKSSSAPVEHDNNDQNKTESFSLDNVPIEDSHDAPERWEPVINQMNSTFDSPKTRENVQNEEMQVTKQHSGIDNYLDLSKNDGESPSSSTCTYSSMEESNVGKEDSRGPENASDVPVRRPAKSPFAYQLSSSKPVKSLFSYQLT